MWLHLYNWLAVVPVNVAALNWANEKHVHFLKQSIASLRVGCKN